jgi:hypothetical protein
VLLPLLLLPLLPLPLLLPLLPPLYPRVLSWHAGAGTCRSSRRPAGRSAPPVASQRVAPGSVT